MQKIAKYFLVAACALLSSNAIAGRTAPLVNIDNVPVTTSSGKHLTADQVRQTIVRAIGETQWTATPAQGGKIVATLEVRHKHTLIVEIPYSAESYSIHYKDSVNLNHGRDEDGVEVIHPNANKWMANLKEAIRVEFVRL
jgi:hypothetical protein